MKLRAIVILKSLNNSSHRGSELVNSRASVIHQACVRLLKTMKDFEASSDLYNVECTAMVKIMMFGAI